MLTANSTFAHFRIVRQLGAGGMGEVFLAEDLKLNRQVALKTLSTDFFDKSEQLDRFYREARTVAQVSHPNVMAIYDLGVAPNEAGVDVTYIVMEYVKGQPLNDYLESASRNATTVLRVAEKIAAGLAAAHKLQIVHRDIKADNILIDEEGEPKILDFGLAKPVAPVQFDEKADITRTVSKDLTRAGKIVGTVSYMSPEQVRGDSIDTRSDIFSFGVLLYRMVTGSMPFSGPSQVVTLVKILESSHESVRTSNEAISPELERIIDKCLQKDPNDRYQDTRDLVVDLRNLRKQYDSGISDSVTGVAAGPRGKAAVQKPRGEKKSFWSNLTWKHVVLLIVVTPFAFVAIIVLGAMLMVANKEDAIQISVDRDADSGAGSLAILGFDNKTGDTTLNWMETGLPEILLTDLTQQNAVPIISRDRLEDHVRSNNLPATYDGYRDAARALGARTILSGSFFNMGERIRIDARMEDLQSGRVVMGEKVVGGDPFALVDSLSARISTSLDLVEPEGSPTIASVTSTSPEAYKAYHIGMDFFQDDRYEEAIEQFEKAIDIDSTFALPYLRIGMAQVFSGKQTAGAQSIGRALQHIEKLPPKERGLLDVYAETWVNRSFNDAENKLESLVRQYPDDKELRTVNALFKLSFWQDTSLAKAEFDAALALDPSYSFALSQLSQMYESQELYEQAAAYAERILEDHPNSRDAFERLARLSRRAGNIDRAISLYEEMLDKFPDYPEPLSYLAVMEIRRRNLDAADQYLEKYRSRLGSDKFKLLEYYSEKSNLAIWQGDLSRSLQLSHKRLAVSLETRDSAAVFGTYAAISGLYRLLEIDDSVLFYVRKARPWANNFQASSYPMTLITIDPANADSADPLIATWVREFKQRVPNSYWTVADQVQAAYEAIKQRDTAAIILALESIQALQGKNSFENNNFEIGSLQASFRMYEKARTALEPFVSGPRESAQAQTYLLSHYYLGLAEEGLGNKDAARSHFAEVLKYLGSTDRSVRQVNDARERLARLGS